VKTLLKEISKKMFTQKRDAVAKFMNYLRTKFPKLSDNSIEYLLVGDRKVQGIVQGVGHVNWKGSFQKYAGHLLDLVQYLLKDYQYNKKVQKVFCSLKQSYLNEMRLNDHIRKRSGNKMAAEWVHSFLQSNGISIKAGKKAKSKDFTTDSNLNMRATSDSSTSRYQEHASGTCLTNDSKKKKGFMNFLSGFFNKRPDLQDLENKGILKTARVFGAPLDVALKNNGKNGIPGVVVDCVEHLMKHLTHEGLFRIPGNNTNIIALKQKYDYGGTFELSGETANDVSGLLKLYLRDMPEPLFPWNTYDKFLEAYGEIQKDEGESIRKIIASIPENRQRVVKYLFKFFNALSLNHAINKMRPRNIAICLAPNILRPQVETLQSVAMDATAVTGVVKFLIEDANPEATQKAGAKSPTSKTTSFREMKQQKPPSLSLHVKKTSNNQVPKFNPMAIKNSLSPRSTSASKKKKFSLSSPPPKPKLRSSSRSSLSQTGTSPPKPKLRMASRPSLSQTSTSTSQSHGLVSPVLNGNHVRAPSTGSMGTLTSESKKALPRVHRQRSQSTQPLPSGWREVKKDGRTFYYNQKEHKSQWERPSISDLGSFKDCLATPTSTASTPGGKKPPPFKKKGHSISRSIGTIESISEVPDVEALPKGWSVHFDKNTKKKFYFNQVTRKSQWVRPTTPA